MKLKLRAGLVLSTLVYLISVSQAVATGFTLTVAAQGSGTVSRNPSNATYPPGVTVTITATPDAGWYFANWSGDTNGSVNPLNVTMNSNLVITGNFLPYPTYPLTLATNGQGNIALNPASTVYQSNTVVTATATPSVGWVFTGWTGTAAGSTNPLSFTMNSSNSLTGNFAQLPAFDLQPTGVTNAVGANVSLSAHSVGAAPVTYQWYFNGTGVTGATNTTLNFNSVQFSSAGGYQVVATNLYGSATSSVALLVVTNGLSNPVSVCDEPSLRAAIAAGGWIQFGCNGTITLSNTITISNNVILDGSLVSATVSGGGMVRIFNINNGASLTITNLTLANGWVTNSLTNTNPADGGAVFNNGGTLNLVGCSLTNNVARNNYNDSVAGFSTIGGFARGGAIFNNGGVVTLMGTTFSNNTAEAGVQSGTANGGAIYMTNGSLTLIGCILSSNKCNSYQHYAAAGGAVCIVSGTSLFTNCLFQTNAAGTGASFAYNGGYPIPGNGGAIAVLGGSMTVNRCQFLSNLAHGGNNGTYLGSGQGGAIYCTTTANIANSSFLFNSAPNDASKVPQNNQGGAIFNSGTMQLNGCCICSNYLWGTYGYQGSAPGNGLGGGIFNAGQLRATNCTIALNTAQAGFAYNSFGAYRANGAAIGGGIYNDTNATTILMNVTLASNVANAFGTYPTYFPPTNGYSAGDQLANTGGTFRLHNTLIAYAGTNGNAYGTITDDGYNISSDGSAALFGGSSYNLTDPKIGPLADNGGQTLTMTPLSNSPAIDFGGSSGAPNSDQRGFLRPFGSGYDIGAVEFNSAPSSPTQLTLTVAAQGSGTVSRNPSNTTYPPGVTVTVTATPAVGWYFANWSGDTNGSVNPLNVTMNSNLVITGNFLPYPTYPLTLTTNGQGSIVLNPANTVYQSNTVVTATATPATGWLFTGWTGTAAGPTNPLSFTMNSSNSLTGNFVQLPGFDVQPVGATNSPGGTVSFFAHSVGTAPVTYQWYFNGTGVTGATNMTLTFTNVTLAKAGNYQIVATNNYGSATSAVVALVLTNITSSTNVVSVCDEPSLRAAITNGGWISIGCNGTITLTGTINITKNVILDATYVSATISGGSVVRLFNVSPGVTFGATNLTFANGACVVTNGSPGTPADGGAIYNNGGAVILVGCTLTNNNAQSLIFGGLARGGAIFNNGGTLALYQSILLTNSVTGGGPNSFSASINTGTGLGGAIYNTNGIVTIMGGVVGGSISTGVVEYNGYYNSLTLAMGGAIFQASGSMTITSSSLTNNQALGGAGQGPALAPPAGPAYGGAVALTGGSLSIDHSQICANTARGGVAGGHGVAGPAYGGAVYSTSTLTASDSSFSGNGTFAGTNTYANAVRGADAAGGAIYNGGNMVLSRCLVCSNYLQGGNIVSSQIYAFGNGGNGLGGGIFNASQLATTNCTIALNTGLGGQGSYAYPNYVGTNGYALGGGLFNNTNAVALLMNDTIAANFCLPSGIGYDSHNSNGFAAGVQIANTNGTVHLHNSLLAYPGANGNAYGTITDDGYNISSDGSAALFGGSSYNFTDPKIGPLADNGGPTLTMAPLASSPAIDFGDSSGAPRSDQRGLLRPFGDGYDIGAVEYGSIYPAPSPVNLGFTKSAPNLILNFTTSPTIIYHLQSSTNLTSWVDVETIGAFDSPSNISRTISPQGNARKFFRVWYQ